jgi:hypothetical protein
MTVARFLDCWGFSMMQIACSFVGACIGYSTQQDVSSEAPNSDASQINLKNREGEPWMPPPLKPFYL